MDWSLRFAVDYEQPQQRRKLIYRTSEWSIDCIPYTTRTPVDFEVVVNTLCLEICYQKAAVVSGYCPLTGAKDFAGTPPEAPAGALVIVDEMEHGWSFGVNDDEWPVYGNKQSGWYCLGYPTAAGQAVAFMQQCIAVVGEGGELVALWLQPVFVE